MRKRMRAGLMILSSVAIGMSLVTSILKLVELLTRYYIGGAEMAQKNATPTKEQKAVMEKRGLKPAFWVVVNETYHSLIVKQRITGEFRVIDK